MKKDKIILKGIGASPCVARGKVKIVKGIEDSEKFNEGDILVTHLTDPTMIIMMAKAGAIVCDIGGITSHPAIVGRELGIPCVVNVKEATLILRDGMDIKVNGDSGKFFLIF